MPRKPIDYSKTIIYKLVCNDLNIKDLYVGHTTDFKNRKRCHKSDCSNPISRSYNYKVYKCIRENGGWNNWSMIEIEKYPCKDVNEAISRERYNYELLGGTLNSCVPNRNRKERDYLNKDKIAEQTKQYREEHKEQLVEYNKQYREENKEQLAEKAKQYREEHKEQLAEKAKQYREEHKEQLAEQKKQYREEHKDILNKKYNCECGGKYIYKHRQTHYKTPKHLNYIKSLII
jgi:hypothetical protein